MMTSLIVSLRVWCAGVLAVVGFVMIADVTATAIRAPTAEAQRVPVEVAGCWTGSADITDIWINTRTVAVELNIRTDGSADGRLGDARIEDARVRRARVSGDRWMNVQPDWVINATLRGELVAAEHVRRPTAVLLLKPVRGGLEGLFHTPRLPAGGPAGVAITGLHMRLVRWQPRADDPLNPNPIGCSGVPA